MDHDREPSPQTIKVVDRRRFTAEGSVRADAGPLSEAPRRSPTPAPAPKVRPSRGPEAAGPRQAPAEGTPPPRRAAPPREEQAGPRLEFLPFIATLATNAMAALGMLPDAERQGIPRNPQMAREYIDIIAMLEERTRGNLTDEEAQTMTRLLADLRLQYVELTRSVQPATVAPPVPPHLRQ